MDILDRILEVAQKGYDEAMELDHNPITYEQACNHESGDSLKDHLVIELTEGELGNEFGDVFEIDNAIDNINKSIACLESANLELQYLKNTINGAKS
jgi:hypothetical protein